MLRGTMLSFKTFNTNHPRGCRASAIISTTVEIAPVKYQEKMVPHFTKYPRMKIIYDERVSSTHTL